MFSVESDRTMALHNYTEVIPFALCGFHPMCLVLLFSAAVISSLQSQSKPEVGMVGPTDINRHQQVQLWVGLWIFAYPDVSAFDYSFAELCEVVSRLLALL